MEWKLIALVQERYFSEPEYDSSKIRIAYLLRNANLQHVCRADNPLCNERTPGSMRGRCWWIECEIKAHCHEQCLWEYVAEVYWSEKYSALIGISSCGELTVWQD